MGSVSKETPCSWYAEMPVGRERGADDPIAKMLDGMGAGGVVGMESESGGVISQLHPST